jgi:hypothetical protein
MKHPVRHHRGDASPTAAAEGASTSGLAVSLWAMGSVKFRYPGDVLVPVAGRRVAPGARRPWWGAVMAGRWGTDPGAGSAAPPATAGAVAAGLGGAPAAARALSGGHRAPGAAGVAAAVVEDPATVRAGPQAVPPPGPYGLQGGPKDGGLGRRPLGREPARRPVLPRLGQPRTQPQASSRGRRDSGCSCPRAARRSSRSRRRAATWPPAGAGSDGIAAAQRGRSPARSSRSSTGIRLSFGVAEVLRKVRTSSRSPGASLRLLMFTIG